MNFSQCYRILSLVEAAALFKFYLAPFFISKRLFLICLSLHKFLASIYPLFYRRAIEENSARRKAEEIAQRRLQEQLENQQDKADAEATAKATSQTLNKQKSLIEEMNSRLENPIRDRKVAVSIYLMSILLSSTFQS